MYKAYIFDFDYTLSNLISKEEFESCIKNAIDVLNGVIEKISEQLA